MEKLTAITVDPENANYCSVDGVLFDINKTELLCYPAGKSETSYDIPNGVTSITGAFYGCSNLTDITIPNSVTSIGKSSFYNCTGLKNITIPNSVTSIGDWAFLSCSSLTSVHIPDGVTSIGWCTFYVCHSLENITIPDSVTSIDGNAFGYCENLKTVYYGGSSGEWNNITISTTGDSYLTGATKVYAANDAVCVGTEESDVDGSTATGFTGTISSDTSVDKAVWKITSGETTVKTPVNLNTTITGGEAVIGIVLDGLYDENATATVKAA